MNDVLSTDNQNEESSSSPYIGNKEDAERIDNFVDKLSNNHKPSGENVGSSPSSGSTPTGSNVGESPAPSGGSPSGSNVNSSPTPSGGPSGAEIGSSAENLANGAANGSNLANATEAGTALAEGGSAMAEGGTALAEGGAAMVEGGTALAEAGGTMAGVGGAAATDAGVAVAAGVPTGGIGTVVVIAATVAAGVVAGAVKIAKEIGKTMDNKKESSIGTIPTLIMCSVVALLIIIVVAVIVPSSGLALCVDYAKEKIEDLSYEAKGKVSSLTEKGKFFEDILKTDELDISDGELYETINTQQQMDANNVTIYKAIIDKGIEDSYDKYIKAYCSNPKIIISTLASYIGLNHFSRKATELRLKNQKYYYATGNYSVQDYLDGNVPSNNDLNYAEIITVFSQGDDESYNNISYSDFYDKLVGNPEAPHVFFEMTLDKEKTYFYWLNKEHTEYKITTEDDAKAHAMTIKDVIDNLIGDSDDENDTSDSTADDTSDTTSDEYEEEGEPSEEDAAAGNYGWGYFYDFHLYPYGLFEIYRCAGLNYSSPSPINSQYQNVQVLDMQEEFLRLYLENEIELGPSCSKPREFDSNWKSLYDNPDDCTGRTELTWIDPNDDSVIVVNDTMLGQIASSYEGGDSGMVLNYTPTGDAVILNLVEPYYINQGDHPVQRGEETYFGNPPKLVTISTHGCIDCSFTMAASYINKVKYNVEPISKPRSEGGFIINGGQSFYWSEFCSSMGLDYSQKTGAELDDIIEHINQGFPVEIQMQGTWYGNGDRIYYSSWHDEHHFLIVGYDSVGLYIADPGSKANTKCDDDTARVIPYEDFANLKVINSVYIFTTNGYEPDFVVNTLSN